jgi:hypothetical protein
MAERVPDHEQFLLALRELRDFDSVNAEIGRKPPPDRALLDRTPLRRAEAE